jgi:hypothetical protein
MAQWDQIVVSMSGAMGTTVTMTTRRMVCDETGEKRMLCTLWLFEFVARASILSHCGEPGAGIG